MWLGAGGLALAGRAQRVILSDPNPLAVRFSRVNAELAGVENVEVRLGSFLEALMALRT